jgi:uncharacterized membrane protein YqjE
MTEDRYEPSPRTEVGDQLRQVTDGVTRLVSEHVELAKAELAGSVRRAGRDAVLVGLGAGLAALGWVLLMFAVAWGLGQRLGTARGFLVVAAVHVVVGGAMATVFGSRLSGRDKPAMGQTAAEVRQDRRFLQRMRRTLREG